MSECKPLVCGCFVTHGIDVTSALRIQGTHGHANSIVHAGRAAKSSDVPTWTVVVCAVAALLCAGSTAGSVVESMSVVTSSLSRNATSEVAATTGNVDNSSDDEFLVGAHPVSPAVNNSESVAALAGIDNTLDATIQAISGGGPLDGGDDVVSIGNETASNPRPIFAHATRDAPGTLGKSSVTVGCARTSTISAPPRSSCPHKPKGPMYYYNAYGSNFGDALSPMLVP